MTAPATKFGGPKSPPIASKAIFTESSLANFGVRFKAKIWGAQAARLFFAAAGGETIARTSGTAVGHDRLGRRENCSADLFPFDRQDLPAFIITARWTGAVRRNCAAALRALVQLRPVPAVCGLARAQPHLRSLAFRNSHVSRLSKHGFVKKQSHAPAVDSLKRLKG